MEVSKVHNYFRWFVYVFELYFLYSLQQTLVFGMGLFCVRSLMIIPALVSIALFEKESNGMVFGIITGALLDFSFGNPIGIYALFMGLIGYALGVLSTYFVRANLLMALVASAVITSAIVFCRFYFNYVLMGFNNANFAWLNICTPVIIYSVIATPIIFLFNRSISYFLGNTGGEQNKIKHF